jgi:hypothetical protein
MTLNDEIESGTKIASAGKGRINNGLRTNDATRIPAGPRGYSAAFEEIWRAHARQILRVLASLR